MRACPVPRCSACTTNCTPLEATAARTRSASWPMMTKMSRGDTTLAAVAITCARIDFPPTSCRTFGCLDFSRVPLPAAMMAMATRGDRAVEDDELLADVFVIVSQIRSGSFLLLVILMPSESRRFFVYSRHVGNAVLLAAFPAWPARDRTGPACSPRVPAKCPEQPIAAVPYWLKFRPCR